MLKKTRFAFGRPSEIIPIRWSGFVYPCGLRRPATRPSVNRIFARSRTTTNTVPTCSFPGSRRRRVPNVTCREVFYTSFYFKPVFPNRSLSFTVGLPRCKDLKGLALTNTVFALFARKQQYTRWLVSDCKLPNNESSSRARLFLFYARASSVVLYVT